MHTKGKFHQIFPVLVELRMISFLFYAFWIIYNAYISYCSSLQMSIHKLDLLHCVKITRPLVPLKIHPGYSSQVILTIKVWEIVIVGLGVAVGNTLKYIYKKGKQKINHLQKIQVLVGKIKVQHLKERSSSGQYGLVG